MRYRFTIVTLTLIFVALAQSPWFSWHANALSDMDVSQTPDPFNAALLIGRLTYLMFVVGFLRWLGLTSAGLFGIKLLRRGARVQGALTVPHKRIAVTEILATVIIAA